MVEKRAKKIADLTAAVKAPELEGPPDADVTLLGFGSTEGVIRDARKVLDERGVSANQLAVKWIKPFHGDAIAEILGKSKKVLLVENNYSGQFYRYLQAVRPDYARSTDTSGSTMVSRSSRTTWQTASKDHLGEQERGRRRGLRTVSRDHGLGLGETERWRRRHYLSSKRKDFKGRVDPDWCPGCGDFGLLNADPESHWPSSAFSLMNVVCISGIGCSSNFPGYLSTYGMHTLHGRALAVATGVKFANPELTVIIAGRRWRRLRDRRQPLHPYRATQRRHDVPGHEQPDLRAHHGPSQPRRARVGMKTKSTPFGNLERPVQRGHVRRSSNGATFVARGFSGHGKHLVSRSSNKRSSTKAFRSWTASARA